VTGTIKTESGEPVPGAMVNAIGYASSGVSDSSGVYTLTGLITGTYTLFPSKGYYSFLPFTRTVNIPSVAGGQDFIMSSTVVFWRFRPPVIT